MVVVITITNDDVRQPQLLTAKLLMEQVVAKFGLYCLSTDGRSTETGTPCQTAHVTWCGR